MLTKWDNAFGKNDIRGIYNDDITEELFYNIAIGYTSWISEQTQKQPENLKISVCMDARLHSPSLKRAILNGLSNSKVGKPPTSIVEDGTRVLS